MSKTTEIRSQIWEAVAPAAANNTGVLAAQTLPTSGTTTISSGFTQPDVPRTIRLKGNQTTVQGLTPVVVTGTDILGKVISENVTMGGAFATPTDTVNAFASVTSIVFPTRGGASDTISVGFGAALGLDSYCNAYSFNGFPSQVASYTSSKTVISLNVATLSASLDGSTAQAVHYVPYVFPAYGRTNE